MGEVYRARDTKLKRDVAIKILPQEFSLDLARIFEDESEDLDSSNSPTLVSATAGGVILGTAAYMSPDQARGQKADKQSDVWAFGCVLYEMLTGQPTFRGQTVTDILSSIIRSEPDWSAL